MNKFFIISLVLFIMLTASAHAQQLVINKKNGESIISGTIAEIRNDSITLTVKDDKRIKVNIEDLDLERGHLDDYFSEGMNVQIVGKFEGTEIDAKRIMKINESPYPAKIDID